MKACSACHLCYPDESATCPVDGARLAFELDGSPVLDGKYAVERRLGQGGMGVVYRVRHLGLQRVFALKLLRSEGAPPPSFLARFEVEATALGRLEHPGIVDVTDYGIDPRAGGLPYLVMEHLEGRTLQEHCHEVGPLSIEQALPLLGPLAEAVDFAHHRSVLHRDLKPANVFLCPDGRGGWTVKVLDFGLARLITHPGSSASSREAAGETESVFGFEMRGPSTELRASAAPDPPSSSGARVRPGAERLTKPGSVDGTLAYMAPEVFRGVDATRSSDVYAFGVLAYEVLAGRLPFQGVAADVIRAHLTADPPAPSTVQAALPREVDATLLAALAKDPAARPASARAVVAGLREAGRTARRRQWLARELPRRLGLSVALGLALTVCSTWLWESGFARSIERRTVDGRFALQPTRAPDPRLLLVLIDEASLKADPAPLPARGDEFGGVLERVFEAGARAVALDLVLPQSWSRSPAFSRLILLHPEALTLGVSAATSGEIVGTEALGPLTTSALGPARASALFGLTNLEEDDGVVRRGRLAFADRDGQRRLTWAARAAQTLVGSHAPDARQEESFWLDQALDWPSLPRVSWMDLSHRLDSEPEAVRGRLVLVGGDYSGAGDLHRIPWRPGRPTDVAGIVVQAMAVDTILAGLPYRETPPLPTTLVSLAVLTTLLVASLCWARRGRVLASFAGVVSLHFLVALVAFRTSGRIVPVAGPSISAAVTVLVGLIARGWLSPFPEADQK